MQNLPLCLVPDRQSIELFDDLSLRQDFCCGFFPLLCHLLQFFFHCSTPLMLWVEREDLFYSAVNCTASACVWPLEGHSVAAT